MPMCGIVVLQPTDARCITQPTSCSEALRRLHPSDDNAAGIGELPPRGGASQAGAFKASSLLSLPCCLPSSPRYWRLLPSRPRGGLLVRVQYLGVPFTIGSLLAREPQSLHRVAKMCLFSLVCFLLPTAGPVGLSFFLALLDLRRSPGATWRCRPFLLVDRATFRHTVQCTTSVQYHSRASDRATFRHTVQCTTSVQYRSRARDRATFIHTAQCTTSVQYRSRARDRTTFIHTAQCTTSVQYHSRASDRATFRHTVQCTTSVQYRSRACAFRQWENL